MVKAWLGIQYMQISLLLLLARETLDVGSELVWISAGSTLRTAIYIGLHKDPIRLPRMTLLEAEMRRRIWNSMLEILLQASLESGGPFSISFDDYNTEPPGNFDDEDLMAIDPTAKPSNTYTQTSVAGAMRKTFAARVAVVRFLNDLSSAGTYKETLRIDTMLRATYKTLRSTLQGFAPDAPLAPSRFVLQSVDFLMQRYISSLHVPFLGPSLQDPVYAFSRKAVVDASWKLWSLAHPPGRIYDLHCENDLTRLCRNSAGIFRTSTYHASSCKFLSQRLENTHCKPPSPPFAKSQQVLAVDLRAQVQEDDNISSTALSATQSTVIDDALTWYLACIESGETAIKGYLLLRFLRAQVDATRNRVQSKDIPALLVEAADEAMDKAYALLESLAGPDQCDGMGGGMDHQFDVNMPQDLMGDWDLIMEDSFRFPETSLFSTFLG